MSKSPNQGQAGSWKNLGQVWAALTGLYTLVSQLWRKMEIGSEIIEWLNNEECHPGGKGYFERKLREIGLYYKSKFCGVLYQEISYVDRDGFDRFVSIEKLNGELFVDGRKVVIKTIKPKDNNANYLVEREDFIKAGAGHIKLCKDIADFLTIHPEFFPETWKEKLEWAGPHKNTVPHICFVGSLDFNSNGYQYESDSEYRHVALQWNHDKVRRDCRKHFVEGLDHIAVLE